MNILLVFTVCHCSNSRKHSQIAMKFIHVIGIYYNMFGIENKLRSIYVSFTGTPKIILLHYRLWVESVCVVFEYHTIKNKNY